MANIKSRTSELEKYMDNAPLFNIDRIDSIISLYGKLKILNYKTALTAIKLLASKNKHTIDSGNAVNNYNKIHENISMRNREIRK